VGICLGLPLGPTLPGSSRRNRPVSAVWPQNAVLFADPAPDVSSVIGELPVEGGLQSVAWTALIFNIVDCTGGHTNARQLPLPHSESRPALTRRLRRAAWPAMLPSRSIKT